MESIGVCDVPMPRTMRAIPTPKVVVLSGAANRSPPPKHKPPHPRCVLTQVGENHARQQSLRSSPSY
jgi:hypothetical protein